MNTPPTTLSQSVILQLTEIKGFIFKPLVVITILLIWLPSNLANLYLIQSSFPTIDRIKKLANQTQVNSFTQLLETVSVYFTNTLVIYFMLSLIVFMAYMATIISVHEAISKRQAINANHVVAGSLKMLPRVFLIGSVIILLSILWLIICQGIIPEIGGLLFPIGYVLLIALLMIAPIISYAEHLSALKSVKAAIGLNYAQQTHFSLSSIIMFLCSLIVSAYFCASIGSYLVESIYQTKLHAWILSINVSPYLMPKVVSAIIFSVVSLGASAILTLLAAFSTTSYIILKELQLAEKSLPEARQTL